MASAPSSWPSNADILLPALPGVECDRPPFDQQVAARGDLALGQVAALPGFLAVFPAELQAAEGQVFAVQLGARLRHFRPDFLPGLVD